jgi:cephalosporin-C deacetylase-like acetyl esterase
MLAAAWLAIAAPVRGDDKPAAANAAPSALASQLATLPANVFPAERREELAGMIREDIRERLRAANERSSQAWQSIKTRDDWQRFRDERIAALRRSLGRYPEPPKSLVVHQTGAIEGDGFRVERLVFQSRPDNWVTANLYVPARPPASMPGILIAHSHHTPKTHGELQDMGMTWARAGCLVLVPDQHAYGERRGHPFNTSADFAGTYQPGRQDYYYRYDNGVQLHLIGDSLMGWMAWDLMRCVDLLLSRPGIDPKRISLLGSVAGGGDPAAVTGAIEDRIACAAPFNFGGPQPETRYPLPEDVEVSFHYAGGGSWESTRNLTNSAGDGFLPWVIVGGIAPRKLIYGHEFAWHRERDPVWKRLETIWERYGAGENLAFTHGRGELRGQPPEATHCGHIGAPHRVLIHAAFAKWFDIPASPETEYSNRLPSADLMCFTSELRDKLKPLKPHELIGREGAARVAAAREAMAKEPRDARRGWLRKRWNEALGGVEPAGAATVVSDEAAAADLPGVAEVRRVALRTEPGILVPLVLLVPKSKPESTPPVVVAVAQEGKEALLKARAGDVAALLAAGTAVCLVDVRGTGETAPDRGRDERSSATGLSSSDLMLGTPVLGSRLRDLRSVLAYLRGRTDVDARRLALWGDSLAAVNGPDTDFKVPRRADGRPRQSEPFGELAALLVALYEDDVDAVYARGGIDGYASVLDHWGVFIPHDVVVPGALSCGDLADVAGALAPRPLVFAGLVDGQNRRLETAAAKRSMAAAIELYQSSKAEDRLAFGDADLAAGPWLADALRGAR